MRYSTNSADPPRLPICEKWRKTDNPSEPPSVNMHSPSLALESHIRNAESIASGVLRERAEQTDREACWPAEGIRALLQAGLGGLVVPRPLGGAGQGLYGLARICEILGRECTSTAICFGMHCVGSSVIAARCTDDQNARFLQPICAGEHLTTLALSESGTGAHFYFPQMQARRIDGERIRINGAKTFVTNGSHADSYVLSVNDVSSDDDCGTLSCLVLPAEAQGLNWGERWSGMGMRGNDSRSLRLDDVEVPAGNLLGREGDQVWYVFNVVAPYFLIAMAGSYLGLGRAALDCLTDHLKARTHTHSGGRLAEASMVQHRLGALIGKLECARALTLHAARQFDSGEADAANLVMLTKAEVAEAVVGIVNEAMTLMGGIAYAEDGRMSRLLRDARAAHVMAPTTDLLRIWVGRAALGEPLIAE